MKSRRVLTVLWLACFLAGLVVVESYSWRDVIVAGQRTSIATGYGRTGYLRDLLLIYSPPLAAILGFWYMKPLPKPPSDAQENFRFNLALVCAVVFNAFALYALARYHWSPDGLLSDALTEARNAALALDFLVLPANGYYFGAKKR